MKTILTGDRPTGPLHIGHYFGSLKERVALQEQYRTFILIADVQALTDNFDDPQKVHDNIIEVTLDYLAAGIDPEKATIVIQSKMPAIADLTIFFMNLVTVARVGRNPTVKEEIKQKGFGESLPFGFFAYPVSQAADILAFNADLVPVGEDQVPMIEMTREIARDFNRIYGSQVFVEPEAKVGSFGRIKGLDGGAKMSKSLNNAIYLKDSEQEMSKKIMSAYTDPTKARKDDPGHPDGCMVHAYHQIFTPGHAAIKEECLKGGRGCVVCKKELIANMNGYFAPIRQKRLELGNDLGYVRDVLRKGIIKGQEYSGEILNRAKTAMKIDYRDILG